MSHLPNALNVFLKIDTPKLDQLQHALAQLDESEAAKPSSFFDGFEHVFFARFVCFDYKTEDMNKGRLPRLLYSAIHDDTVEAHFAEWLAKAPGHLQEIFGCCIGFPTSSGDEFRRAFVNWINEKDHKVEPRAYFQAYRDQPITQVKKLITHRKVLNQILDAPATEVQLEQLATTPQYPPKQQQPSFWQQLMDQLNAWVGTSLAPWLLHLIAPGPEPIVPTSVNIPALLPPAPSTSDDALTRMAKKSVVNTERTYIVQNELTIISDVDYKQLWRLKLVLLIINLAQNPPPDGTLSGVSTIHFAYWTTFDEDRAKRQARLLFVSNYDGTWEHYIGEFVDRAYLGLDAIWGRSTKEESYPRQGARNIEEFEVAIRTHQHRAELFYSAVPFTSVKNIISDLKAFNSTTLDNVFNSESPEDVVQKLAALNAMPPQVRADRFNQDDTKSVVRNL